MLSILKCVLTFIFTLNIITKYCDLRAVFSKCFNFPNKPTVKIFHIITPLRMFTIKSILFADSLKIAVKKTIFLQIN